MLFFSRGVGVPSFKSPIVSDERRVTLLSFQKKVGLKFKNIELLDLAFCHRSFVNEVSEDIDNNERLEFLGDSVLGVVVADYLFRLLPDRPEGDLARVKSHVVSENSLFSVAKTLGLDSIIRVGRGEELSGGRHKKALLSDCMEAVIGAFYLDAGYDKTSEFILRYLREPIATVLADKHSKDYKTLLQEFVQRRFRNCPRYLLDRKIGPDHQQTFWVTVLINNKKYGTGAGSSKKSAEQESARIAWEKMQQEST